MYVLEKFESTLFVPNKMCASAFDFLFFLQNYHITPKKLVKDLLDNPGVFDK